MNGGTYQSHKNFVVTINEESEREKREYEFLTHKDAKEFWLKLHQAGQPARLYKLGYKSGNSEPKKISLEY